MESTTQPMWWRVGGAGFDICCRDGSRRWTASARRLPTATLMLIPPSLAARLHAESGAGRWHVSPEAWQAALAASAARAFAGADPAPADVERHLRALHLDDLALAVACAAGDDDAWQHFVLTFRPVLYRAADAIAPGGDARDLADALHAELFGLGNAAGVRTSLFRYFHGRSSLATWLSCVAISRFRSRLPAQGRSCVRV